MIRTFLIVTIVTILVWIWAEDQTLRTEEIEVSVILSPGSATKVVRPLPGQNWTGIVTLRVQGSARRMRELEGRAQEPITLAVGKELPGDPGVYDLQVAEILRRHERFAERGSTIAETSPTLLVLEVDAVAVVEAPVRVVTPELQVEGVPAVDPLAVTVRVPAKAAERAAAEGRPLFAEAMVTREMVARFTPGRTERLPSVRVQRPEALADAWSFEMVPSTVAVELTLASQSDEYVIEVLPVQIQVAPAELNRWEINIAPGDQDLRNVRLTGPAELIQRIRDRQIEVTAAVRLNFEELERGITSKEAALFGLPQGVSAQVEERTVHLDIRPRATIDEPATPGG